MMHAKHQDQEESEVAVHEARSQAKNEKKLAKKAQKKLEKKAAKKRKKKEKKRQKKEEKKKKKEKRKNKKSHGKCCSDSDMSSSTSSSSSLAPSLSGPDLSKIFREAVIKGDTAKARHTLLHGGFDWQDEAGNSPLHIAVRENCLPVVDFLLRRQGKLAAVDDALLEGRNSRGETPLLVATRRFRGRAALRLLYALADPGAVDKQGESPEMLGISSLVEEAEHEEAKRADEVAARLLGAVSAAREAREAAEWRRRLFEEATGDSAAPYDDFLDLEHKDTGTNDWTEDIARQVQAREQARYLEEQRAARRSRQLFEEAAALGNGPHARENAQQPQETASSEGPRAKKKARPSLEDDRPAAGSSGSNTRNESQPATSGEEERMAARARDEQRWQHFERTWSTSAGAREGLDSGQRLEDQVPFPSGPSSNPLLLDTKNHPAVLRSQLRAALLRWHPDKFMQRFGSGIMQHTDVAGRDAVLGRVKTLAQQLTEMMSNLAQ